MSLNQAKVKYHRIKNRGIITEIYHIPQKVKNDVLLFCYGMPSHPFDRFPFGLEPYLEDGYVLAYPHYEGTFGSDGVCRIENAVNSVTVSLDTLINEKLYDIFTRDLIDIKPKRIVLTGSSFGGSIALVTAAKSHNVNDVISVAAVSNYRDHNRITGQVEYDLVGLEREMKRAYKEWNIDFSVWQKYVTGKLDINPIDYVEELKSKNTLLIHGDKDLAVSVNRSIELHDKIKSGHGKHRLYIVHGVGHLGAFYIGNTDVYTLVKTWLN